MDKLSDQELIAAFPEAKQIIPEVIKEWKSRRLGVTNVIKQKLAIIKQKSAAENQWFWRELVKNFDVPTVIEIDKNIGRLTRLQNLADNKPMPHDWISLQDIALARSTSVVDIASEHTKLRKRGKNLVGLCPLHKEKSPSFTVYPESNTWHCFGCSNHGDVIKLIKVLLGLSFREAVRYLIRK